MWAASSNDDVEKPVAISNPEESLSIWLDENVHQKKSYELDQSPALDAMLSTLLPDYVASQQPSVSSAGESTLPASRSNFPLMEQPSVTLETSRMEVDQSERENSQAPLESDISRPGTYHRGNSFDC